MNYEDEDYVRFFTRDTVSWLALGWEGQAVLSLMLHGKFDRSGVFDCDGHTPSHAVTMVTRMPEDVVERGLERLFASGTWIHRNGRIVWPKYVHAQTCRRSDRARQRESREKRRMQALAEVSDDSSQPSVTPSGDTPSQDVTYSLAEPSLAEPSRADTEPSLADGAGGPGPCPTDLWARVPEDTRAALELEGIPRWAQETTCRAFATRYSGGKGKPRPVDRWVSTWQHACREEWHDPNKRPRKPSPKTSRADLAASEKEIAAKHRENLHELTATIGKPS